MFLDIGCSCILYTKHYQTRLGAIGKSFFCAQPQTFHSMEQFILASKEDIRSIVGDAIEAHTQNQVNDAKRYVYGLRGIRELFNVSHATAQKYKNTFLAKACMQRGRKIVVDVEMARMLFSQKGVAS